MGRPKRIGEDEMSGNEATIEQIRGHLAALASRPGGRPVGSEANWAAEGHIADALRAAGYAVEQQGFDCIEWQLYGVELWVGDGPLPVTANPYSPPCDVTAPLVAVGSLVELEAAELHDRIALLHGPLAAEPLFPRNFPFFTHEEHRRVADLLEQKGARAVIAASPMPAAPAPIIEDGDFTLPSVTVAAHVGAVLLSAGSAPVTVRLHSSARPGRAANVIGRRAHPAREKLLLSAHFDTKPGTPGALDNAAGVATLLALAERLAAAPPAINLEFVYFNGEDHYASPGEVAYIAGCGGEFGRIRLVINVDGVGLRDSSTTVAFFNCSETQTEAIRTVMSRHAGLEETEPWPQGDHMVFAMQGVPCIALTSGGVHSLIDSLIHTPKDTIDRLDPARLATAVDFLADLLASM
jgi:aminopeptidase YwaD